MWLHGFPDLGFSRKILIFLIVYLFCVLFSSQFVSQQLVLELWFVMAEEKNQNQKVQRHELRILEDVDQKLPISERSLSSSQW